MKKVSDEEFIEAFLASGTREEVARRTGLTKASVTDRAAALRRKGVDLPKTKFSGRSKTRKDVANLAAANLLEAVKGDREQAIKLIKQEAYHQVASKVLALLAAVRAPADAIQLLRCYPYKPKPEPKMEINLD